MAGNERSFVEGLTVSTRLTGGARRPVRGRRLRGVEALARLTPFDYLALHANDTGWSTRACGPSSTRIAGADAS